MISLSSELRLRAHDLTGLFVDCSTFLLLQGNEVLESAHFLFVSTPHAELLVLPTGAAIVKLSVAGAATSTQRIYLLDVVCHLALFFTNAVEWMGQTSLQDSTVRPRIFERAWLVFYIFCK